MPNPVDDIDLNYILNASLPATGQPPVMLGSNQTYYLQNAIVLRGYLADPQLAMSTGTQLNPTPNPLIALTGNGSVQVWRIYLSARMDVYVDFLAPTQCASLSTYRRRPTS